MTEKKNYDRVSWQQFSISSGELLNSGIQHLGKKTSRITGPGVNNTVIARLKKGETVEVDLPGLNLKAVFTPIESAW